MRHFILIYFSVIGLTILACETESPLETQYEQVVIQGYLYANESVQDIRITQTLPLGSEETTPPPINDAIVRLIKEGQSYNLIPSEGDSGYYHYPEEDLVVETGDVFEIQVEHLGNTAEGQTEVPNQPENVTLSSSRIYVPEDVNPWDFEFDSTRYQIRIEWEGNGSDLYYVSVENIESNPDTVESGFSGMKRPGRMMISAPTSRTSFDIQYMEIKLYGRHEVKIYHVNQEYADLYISRQQDSRDLNEPLTNIHNGLGIFSAFSSVTVLFDALPD